MGRAAMYLGVAVVLAFEGAAAWQALHPDVPANYRAYYIDRTTTCLDQPVSGAYRFGKAVSFRDNADESRPLRVCGWEGPVGDGLHAVGESSRLRFAVPSTISGDLVLSLEIVAVDFSPGGRQPVVVSVNGVRTAALVALSGTPQHFNIVIPEAQRAHAAALDVEFAYPEAILVSPQDSNTRKRSIKLTEARLARSPVRMVVRPSVSCRCPALPACGASRRADPAA